MAPRLKSILTASKTAGKHNAGSQRHASEKAGPRPLALSSWVAPVSGSLFPSARQRLIVALHPLTH
ncbi:hypothetical protein JOQ06_005817, partial [Pogonophryne albipinna]